VSEYAALIAICASCLSAACAVVSWRLASELTSMRTRIRQAVESAESSESRIDELHKRIISLSKKFHLEDRRDPETGKSRRRDDDDDDDTEEDRFERKARMRRKLGLAGLSHVEIARRASGARS
jgi:hypothetical protein